MTPSTAFAARTLRRRRERMRVPRWHRVALHCARATAAVFLGATAILVTGFVDDAATDDTAAACDEVSIPSLALSRCVVSGNQDQIDAGSVVRVTYLSSDQVHWLAGHRTSHGATFNSLPNLRIGSIVWFRGRGYVVTEYHLVDRYHADVVMPWVTSTTPSVVLQTSASSTYVHVWRSVELAPNVPSVATAPPPIPRS